MGGEWEGYRSGRSGKGGRGIEVEGIGGGWEWWEIHRRGGVSVGHCVYTHLKKLQLLLVHFRSLAPSPQ